LYDLLQIPAEVNLGRQDESANFLPLTFHHTNSFFLVETRRPHYGLRSLQREGARLLPKKHCMRGLASSFKK
jgi:hypothetical protein